MKKIFKNIGLIRFILAILIVMFHFKEYAIGFINNNLVGITHCNICVDFFFIMSGFFLFYTTNTKLSIYQFGLKRFLRLAPLLWWFLIFYAVISIFFKNIHFSLTDNILRIFLLHDIGFGPLSGGIGGHVHWYISALFWSTLAYYYLIKLVNNKYHNLIIWLITIISYGLYLNHSHFGTGGNYQNIFYFINIGILRGLGGLGLGYFIHKIYSKTPITSCNLLSKLFITGFEIYLSGLLIHYLFFTTKLPAKSPTTLYLVFSVLFYLFLTNKGYLSSILNNNLFAELGQSSYAIYVMHVIVPPIMKNIVNFENDILTYFTFVITALLLGICTHYLIEIPLNKIIKEKIISKL